MHPVTVLADHEPSQAARAAAFDPPISPNHRVPVQVHRADPHAAEVAMRLGE